MMFKPAHIVFNRSRPFTLRCKKREEILIDGLFREEGINQVLTSIVTSRMDPSRSVTFATAVLPEDPDFFDGDSVIVVDGGEAAVFVSAGILSLLCSVVVALHSFVVLNRYAVLLQGEEEEQEKRVITPIPH